MDRRLLLASRDLAEFSGSRMFDIRWYLDGRDGYQSYLAGHLPGASFIDLDATATSVAQPTAGRHPLPSPEVFVQAIAMLGIEPGRQVILMDDARGSIAARLWWMLDALGIEAYVLQGGVASLESTKLCTSPCPPMPVAPWRPPIDTWPRSRIVTTDAIESDPSRYLLLDARATTRYLGIEEPIDRIGGHIPGARSLPWPTMLDLLETEGWRSDSRIQAILNDDRQLVAYCGSGVTACALVLAFRAIGTEVSLYPASYSGWSSDATHPICTVDCESECVT